MGNRGLQKRRFGALLLLMSAMPGAANAAPWTDSMWSANLREVFSSDGDLVYVSNRPRSHRGYDCAPHQNVPQCESHGYTPVPQAPLPDDFSAPSTGDFSAPSTGDMDSTFGEAPNVASPRIAPERFASRGSSGFNVNDAPGGYIDNPIVGTWFRFRYDAAFNNTVPDRAEFIYKHLGVGQFPDQAWERVPKIDFQDIAPYFEWQLADRLSVFAEIPVRTVTVYEAVPVTTFDEDRQEPVLTGYRYVNPQAFTGIGDMNAGFKYALAVDEFQYATFQLKTYIPTGDAFRYLGTNRVAVEPGLLYLARLSDRLYFQGEARYLVPINGTKAINGLPNLPEANQSFAGSIFRYGGGLGYDLIRPAGYYNVSSYYASPNGLRVTPIIEAVGWSVVNGLQSVNVPIGTTGTGIDDLPIIESARGTTIINLKLGVRTTYGPRSVYVGWGHALTTQNWYEDLFRIEYRRMF
jgi:hypothetical protein